MGRSVTGRGFFAITLDTSDGEGLVHSGSSVTKTTKFRSNQLAKRLTCVSSKVSMRPPSQCAALSLITVSSISGLTPTCHSSDFEDELTPRRRSNNDGPSLGSIYKQRRHINRPSSNAAGMPVPITAPMSGPRSLPTLPVSGATSAGGEGSWGGEGGLLGAGALVGALMVTTRAALGTPFTSARAELSLFSLEPLRRREVSLAER